MTLAPSSTAANSLHRNFFILSIFLATAGAYVALGASDVAISILLKEKNYSEGVIGIIFGLHLITYAGGCLLFSYFVNKFSYKSIFYFSIANTLLALFSFVFPNHPALFGSYYVAEGGFTAIAVVILTNLIATLSHQVANKNLLMGFFSTIASSGYLIGIVLTDRSPIAAPKNFFMITVFFAICVLPLCSMKSFSNFLKGEASQNLRPLTHNHDFIKLLNLIPMGLLCIIIFGMNDSVIPDLVPIWGIHHGMGVKEAAFLSIPILIGGVILTPFLSLPFRRFGYTKIAITYLSILIGLFIIIHILNLYEPKLALPFPNAPLVVKMFDHPLLVIIGGIINTFEALYLCIIADHFKGTSLMETCTFATFLSYVAGAIGCAIGGCIIAETNYHHFGVFLIITNSIFLIALLSSLLLQKYFLSLNNASPTHLDKI